MSASPPSERRLLSAHSAVEGFAIGRSLRFARPNAGGPALGDRRGISLREAVACVRGDLERLLSALPSHEAQLFEPEAYILDDLEPRLLARERDLAAILLDVDNGPEWASFRTNARLYADAALVRTRAALRERGLFAVWSGYAADSFVARLRKAGFVSRIVPLTERGVVRARAYVGVAP